MPANRRDDREDSRVALDAPAPDSVKAPPEPGGPVWIRPHHLYKAAGLLFLLALVFEHFTAIAHVFLIAYAAAILGVALNALISRIPGQRRWVTGVVGLLLFAGIGAGLWFGGQVLVSQVRDFASRIPEFQEQLQSWETRLQEQTGLNVQLVGPQAEGVLRNAFMGNSQAVLGRARGILEWIILPLLVLFGGLYAVGKPNERLLSPLLRSVPRDRREAFRRVFELLGARLLGWAKGTLLAMLIVGGLSTVALYVIGVRYALLLGLWAGLTEFIPLVGPWIGGLTAVTVAFFQDPSKALLTAAVMLAIQQLESNVITPLVMAKVADVHPFVTLFAIFLFGSLFGFLGILLALPIVFLIWTLVQVLWVERTIDTDEDWIEPVVEE